MEKARKKRFHNFVQTYHVARQAQLEALEQHTAMYPTEVKQYLKENPLITFKQYLIQSRGIPR